MKIEPAPADAVRADVDGLVVGIYENRPLEGAALALDAASGGTLSRLIEREEVSAKRDSLTSLLGLPGVTCPHVVVAGLGDPEAFDAAAAHRAAAAAARRLADRKRPRAAFYLGQSWTAEQAEAGLCGAVSGCRGSDLYRSERKRHPFEQLYWAGADETVMRRAEIVGEAVQLARRLVNEPPSVMTPEAAAREAKQAAGEAGLEVEVWDHERLAAERCGALLAVARGSARPPRLVILRHRGGEADKPQLALAGKGVTFDSGGLSLKPSDSMKTMKGDLAGAAAVIAAMRAIAQLRLPLHVIGLAGLVENMPGGDSYQLGDVLTARNGKTIEVLNTDAEGRLVLADVLSLAVEQEPERLLDLATLTGACMVALGTETAGVMTNNQPWCDQVLAAARACGEPAWQLPMFAFYEQQIKSGVADIKNIGEGRWGGAITAAKFLEQFVGDTPWVHIDIAGPAFLDSDKAWQDAGGTGAMVRTVVETARRLAES